MTDHAHAMSIAWEQVAYWQREGLRAHDAADILELNNRLPTWDDVARKLARMWISVQPRDYLREAA